VSRLTRPNNSRAAQALSQAAFGRLLGWLDDRRDSRGDTYLEIRRRLVAYFDRRSRPSPDELADETLTRIGRTLEETGAIAITPPARYCYVVARLVLLEDFGRERPHAGVGAASAATSTTGRLPTAAADRVVSRELRSACLERCLSKLKPDQRELVAGYYGDARKESRESIDARLEMANRLGITVDRLRIRACRIRGVLEACVEACHRES
jgi:DNA-directed RNA polymerase specialized sigma24 family protein